MRIIVADTAPLYPPLWGGPKRIWHLFGTLSEDDFQIDYVGIDWRLKGSYRVRRISPNFREFIFPLPSVYKLWYPLHKVFFRKLNLDLFLYFGVRLCRDFCYVLNNLKGDVFIFSHPWSALCLKDKKGHFFIYDAHNCEYSLMKHLTKNFPFGSIISHITMIIEKETCRKSDIVIVCSQEEKEDFKNIYGIGDEKIKIIPNGATVRKFQEEERKKAKEIINLKGDKNILFVGAYYRPNIEAVKFIITDLSRRFTNCNFVIAGKVGDYFQNMALPSNICFLGELSEEKLDFVFKASDLAINPVISGAGVNIKLLDYLSYGLPVVSTPTGIRGI